MSKMSARSPSATFTIKTGTEGPRFDPYGFREIVIDRKNGDLIVFHEGIGVSLTHNGQRVKENASEKAIRQAFALLSGGHSPEQIEDYINSANSRCKKCGCKHSHAEQGYPGETLYLCNNCGNISGSTFSEAAVM